MCPDGGPALLGDEGSTSEERLLKVMAWNLGHRIQPKAIPATLPEIFAELDVDTVLLNEFVDAPDRAAFRAGLVAAGYPNQLVSYAPGRHNQVFVASRCPLVAGDLAGPRKDGPSQAGFLHVRFADTRLELVGMRAPAYKTTADKVDYWGQCSQRFSNRLSRGRSRSRVTSTAIRFASRVVSTLPRSSSLP